MALLPFQRFGYNGQVSSQKNKQRKIELGIKKEIQRRHIQKTKTAKAMESAA